MVTLAVSAAGLVMLSDPGDELGDVVLTSSDAFPVVRLVADGAVIEAHLKRPRRAALPDPALAALEPAGPGTAVEARPAPPRRQRAEPPAVTFGELPPDWFDVLGQPYRTDDGVLDQIVVALRRS